MLLDCRPLLLLYLSENRKKERQRERENERKQTVKGLTEGENTAFRPLSVCFFWTSLQRETVQIFVRLNENKPSQSRNSETPSRSQQSTGNIYEEKNLVKASTYTVNCNLSSYNCISKISHRYSVLLIRKVSKAIFFSSLLIKFLFAQDTNTINTFLN